MDIGDSGGDISGGFGAEDEKPRPRVRQLPDDLPKSLDDRKNVSSDYMLPETEMYDAWQGGTCSPSCSEQSTYLHLGSLTDRVNDGM